MIEISPNLQAFLATLKFSELGQALIDHPLTDRGYKVIVGSTPTRLILMESYASHPRRLIQVRQKNGTFIPSTAAGAYQLLGRYYDHYKALLKLPDFSPPSQDQIAIQQIKEQRALDLIEGGSFQKAIAEVANIWASLPGAGYGQHENRMDVLANYYERAGGQFS